MKVDIARALRDANYRNSLSEEQKAQLPANPVGDIELMDSELADVAGGTWGLVTGFVRGQTVNHIGGSSNTSGGDCDTYENITYCSYNDGANSTNA